MLSKRCLQVALLCTGLLCIIVIHPWITAYVNGEDDSSEVSLSQTNSLSKEHILTRRHSSKQTSTKQLDEDCAIKLPDNITSAVQKFVFFIGYARSGHSIIGSILDAHPNVVISHEYSLFQQWPKHDMNRTYLYNSICSNSCYNSHKGLRRHSAFKKGYSLHINGSWQGEYNDYIAVIGDKSGGMTTKAFKAHQRKIAETYSELLRTTQVPAIAIHALRNPFDNIATMMLYNSHMRNSKSLVEEPFSNPIGLEAQANSYFNQVQSVVRMIDHLKLNVIEIYNDDLIRNPKKVLRKLCRRLHLKCTKEYIAMCAKAIFKTASRSRFLVKWTPEIIDMVQRKIETYPFLRRYSFY